MIDIIRKLSTHALELMGAHDYSAQKNNFTQHLSIIGSRSGALAQNQGTNRRKSLNRLKLAKYALFAISWHELAF